MRSRFFRCLLVVLGLCSVTLAREPEPLLSLRNPEAPFCYRRGAVRSWPVLHRRPNDGEVLSLVARRDGQVMAQGATVTIDGVVLSLRDVLTVDARNEPALSPPLNLELTLTVTHGAAVESQTIQLRPAPPDRPISYIADLVDDLIRIFARPEQGDFRPLQKDGFDQYFRRLQAHGVSRLIVWHSPFPYFTRPEDHAPEHWDRYVQQARAILDNRQLSQGLQRSRSLPSWLWLRFLMQLRLNPDAGELFAQSAAEHGIALTASFRPFEAALTKYYEVPAFDREGQFLWGFLPLATPAVNYAPETLAFAHYRQVLDSLGQAELGRLKTIELPGVSAVDAAQLIAAQGPTGGFHLHASRVPPLASQSLVLVRDEAGRFQLQPYSAIAAKVEAARLPIPLRLETHTGGSVQLVLNDLPHDVRFLILTHSPADPAKSTVTLDTVVPVILKAEAGNRLNRETVYWILDPETPAGQLSRVAGITPDGEYRAIFQACTGTIQHLNSGPRRLALVGNGVVIDRGDLWSVEAIDFQQPAARQMAVTQLKTLLSLPGVSRPAYDEIFLSTRSHVDLAPTMADGLDGQKTLAEYYRTGGSYLHHLGLDKAFAPRSVARQERLRKLAESPQSAEEITTWQVGEWRDSCQQANSKFAWRLARNLAVADGISQLLRDLEREFPQVRLRAIVPPKEATLNRMMAALEQLPDGRGGVYGREYYRRLWCSNNHIPAIGEGMALVDLSGTRVEPVFLGSGAYQFDRAPFELFIREQIADLADNRGSSFRGPRSYFYEGQFTLRAPDLAAARKHREMTLRTLLAQKQDIREVLLYEAADWLYFLPLSDPDLCGHGFLDRAADDP